MGSGGGATAIRVPYRHIRDAETELVRLNSTTGGSDAARPKEEQGSGHTGEGGGRKGAPRYRVVLAYMVAAGVQFGWTLQPTPLSPVDHRSRAIKRVIDLPGNWISVLEMEERSRRYRMRTAGSKGTTAASALFSLPDGRLSVTCDCTSSPYMRFGDGGS